MLVFFIFSIFNCYTDSATVSYTNLTVTVILLVLLINANNGFITRM